MSKSDKMTLNRLLQIYAEKNKTPNQNYELEVKFGTRNIKKIRTKNYLLEKFPMQKLN